MDDLNQWAWRRDRDIAAGQIYLALEPSQRVHIRGMEEDPIKMWEKLAEVHVQKRPGVRFNAYDVLFNIRKKEDESLVSLMGRVDTAIQDIKALRTKDFKLEDADDKLTCMAMIRALPADYSSFVSSLLLLEKLDKAKLQDAFIAEESNRKPCPTVESPIALHTSTPSTSTSQCTFCQSNGHPIDQCFAYKRMQVQAVKERKKK
ncbi:hypothetical protein BD410DRAFT_854976 [Rickenella mellea]|uniref:Uncharacterized protein n=1 Tax=Rickenella mellea TaxID=50990 RepID=A0A4Y7PIH9_9AGAM|nr:hypothetical protein BD410DRAFT_854976 [Rickenella mellea]